MEFNKYNKIGQFRNVVSEVINNCRFRGFDLEGNAILDESAILPIIEFKGTVKLHGTNAAISYNSEEGIKVQSRSKFITVGNDNYGFAAFVKKHESEFNQLITKILNEYLLHDIGIMNSTITIFGEWAGKGIQQGVGISELERAFYIFGISAKNGNETVELDCEFLKSRALLINNINDFENYSIEIDFNNPELAQAKLIELTHKVELECPVTKGLGKSGKIGEGIVWKAKHGKNNYKFKVKGQKHSSTKVKELASIDVEEIQTLKEFAKCTVTDNRFQQALSEVFGEGDLDIKRLGEVIGWLVRDILLEEEDTIVKNNIDSKKVGSYLANLIRVKFFNKLNN